MEVIYINNARVAEHSFSGRCAVEFSTQYSGRNELLLQKSNICRLKMIGSIFSTV
jgi:hypothetical protein